MNKQKPINTQQIMNRRQATVLYRSYRKSFDNGEFNKALEQNRMLYRQIYWNYVNTINGNREIFMNGLNGLEEEAKLILHNIQKINLGRK